MTIAEIMADPVLARARNISDDETLADTTLEFLSYLQTLRTFAGLPEATIQANAMHAAALAFLQCEVGVAGVRRILDVATANNVRRAERDASLARAPR